MTIQLLPTDFDSLVTDAVKGFWARRSGGTDTQGGARGNVISGKNLDDFLAVTMAVARHCGMPDESIHMKSKAMKTIPGYYRPTKDWDVLVVHEYRLVAALEFKSQVGSFGNNANNRTEEALGNATDMLMAHAEGAFRPARHRLSAVAEDPDPRVPFLGYFMLLEECEASTRAVTRVFEKHYPVLSEFSGASYAMRYQLLCERLMEQNLYDAASLLLSPREDGEDAGSWRCLTEATGIRNLYGQFAAHLAAALQSS